MAKNLKDMATKQQLLLMPKWVTSCLKLLQRLRKQKQKADLKRNKETEL